MMMILSGICAGGREMERKMRWYVLSDILAIVMILGTAGAGTIGAITFGEACWQLACSWILGLGAFLLIRLEDKRAAHAVKRTPIYWI
jgi:hypothetical protein